MDIVPQLENVSIYASARDAYVGLLGVKELSDGPKHMPQDFFYLILH